MHRGQTDVRIENEFLGEILAAIETIVNHHGYAHRKDVRLVLWQRFRLGKAATNFILSELAARQAVRLGNRGVYPLKGSPPARADTQSREASRRTCSSIRTSSQKRK